MSNRKRSSDHKATVLRKRSSRLRDLQRRLIFRSMKLDYKRIAPLFEGDVPTGFSVGVLTTEDDKQEARAVVTRRYLADAIIAETDTEVDEKGRVIHRKDLDTTHEHSVYFAVKKEGRVVMTARLIMPHPEKGFASFHLNLDDLYEHARKDLLTNGHSRYTEFSSYARLDDPSFSKTDAFIMRSLLLREMLRFSWLNPQADGRVWLFGLRSHLVPGYRRLFGDGMVRLGDGVGMASFKVDDIPFVIDPFMALRLSVQQARKDKVKRLHLQFFLGGLTPDQLELLANKSGIAVADLIKYASDH